MMPCVALPRWVETALGRLHDNGFQAYAVGGCVRDSLLGKTPHDWDICTSAEPVQTKRVFCDFRVVETGIRHGTVTVLVDAHPLEITTFRTDGAYLDGRRPESVSFVSSLREDLARRDFTINAMACDGGRIVDYFDGMGDLRRGVVRCVGQAERRFEEDALRMLRAVRFAACLGFSIGDETYDALCRMAPRIRLVAAERIREETLRCLAGRDAPALLAPLFLLLREAEPAFCALSEEAAAALARPVRRLPAEGFLRLQLLLWQLAQKDFARALAWLRLARAQERAAQTLYTARFSPLPESAPQARRFINRLGREDALALIALRGAMGEETEQALAQVQQVLSSGACCTLAALDITGAELAALGAKGPEIGALLAQLLDAVMDDALPNERAALIAHARNLFQHIPGAADTGK